MCRVRIVRYMLPNIQTLWILNANDNKLKSHIHFHSLSILSRCLSLSISVELFLSFPHNSLLSCFKVTFSNQNFIRCAPISAIVCVPIVLLLSSSSHYLFYRFFNLRKRVKKKGIGKWIKNSSKMEGKKKERKWKSENWKLLFCLFTWHGHRSGFVLA